VAVRKRNGITPASELTILKYDGDAYVSQIDDKVIMKIGSRYDVSALIPAGYQVVAHGNEGERHQPRTSSGGSSIIDLQYSYFFFATVHEHVSSTRNQLVISSVCVSLL